MAAVTHYYGWVKNTIKDVGWVKNMMGKMAHKCTENINVVFSRIALNCLQKDIFLVIWKNYFISVPNVMCKKDEKNL